MAFFLPGAAVVRRSRFEVGEAGEGVVMAVLIPGADRGHVEGVPVLRLLRQNIRRAILDAVRKSPDWMDLLRLLQGGIRCGRLRSSRQGIPQ